MGVRTSFRSPRLLEKSDKYFNDFENVGVCGIFFLIHEASIVRLPVVKKVLALRDLLIPAIAYFKTQRNKRSQSFIFLYVKSAYRLYM